MYSNSVQSLLGSPFTSKRMLLPILTKKKFVSPDMQYSCVFYDFVGHCITKVFLFLECVWKYECELDDVFMIGTC